ncbi:MAG TPA: hypothetical protein VFU78_07620 [Thermomicrobiales bacterium]|nr:hypothetical protein [Thermomicrobiales bacterium]
MAKNGARTIEQLEREIARLRERLAGDEHTTSPAGFLGGFALGALAGGVLALIFAPQAGDQTRDQLRDASDAILLRGRAGESDTPVASAEAPTPVSPAMPASSPASPAMAFSAPAAPARVDEPAGLSAPSADVNAAPAEVPPPPPPVMASPAPPAPASADVPTPARQPAENLPPSLPGEGGHCPYTHPIKGNKSSSGELIYHLPGTRFYERTNPEVCFATEEAARAAGFRAAKG